jgi:hypothetical protein
MRHVEPYREPRGSGDRAHQVTGPAGEIEDAIVGLDPRKTDQPPFPASILAIRERARDEVVAVGVGGEQSPDVLLFTGRRGEG